MLGALILKVHEGKHKSHGIVVFGIRVSMHLNPMVLVNLPTFVSISLQGASHKARKTHNDDVREKKKRKISHLIREFYRKPSALDAIGFDRGKCAMLTPHSYRTSFSI